MNLQQLEGFALASTATEHTIKFGNVCVIWDGEFEYYELGDFECADTMPGYRAITRDEAAAMLVEQPAVPASPAEKAEGSTAILTREDHAARAVRHQTMAAAYADQQMLDRDAGRADLAAFCQDKAASHAKQARFHLFRALDLAAEA